MNSMSFSFSFIGADPVSADVFLMERKKTASPDPIEIRDSHQDETHHNGFISSSTRQGKGISMLSGSWSSMPERVDIQELTVLGRPWQYRGEGNANIVIALQDDLSVLRLSKVEKGYDVLDIHRDTDEEWSKQKRRIEREVAFADYIFIPLLGHEYVGHVRAVHLSTSHIQQLNKVLYNLRPENRLHKELGIPFATAHRDFARIHHSSEATDYCIEIKPKQGFWPGYLRHAQLCTYCLNQFLKLRKSKIKERTGYCPLDLFSGIPNRMIHAILALLENPQNNLRIFRNGMLVFDENKRHSLHSILQEWTESANPKTAISNFVFLLCTALLKPKGKGSHKTGAINDRCGAEYECLSSQISKMLREKETSSSCDTKSKFRCDGSHQPLPRGCILSRIFNIQKMADIPRGMEGLQSIHSKICPIHNPTDQDGRVIENIEVVGENDSRMNPSDDYLLLSSSPEENYDILGAGECHSRQQSPEWNNNNNDTSSDRWKGSESGLSSLSNDEDEDEDDTLREEECPGPRCLSEPKWLDELDYCKLRERVTEKEIKEVEKYLVAATAKDCSIMVTFSPVRTHDKSPNNDDEHEGDILQDFSGKLYKVRIGVADLDPKPVCCIAKHFIRDSEMLEDYKSYQRKESHNNESNRQTYDCKEESE